jgi:hypothetical protein
MRDTSQRQARRGFLGTLGLAAVTGAGCSSLSGTQSSQSGIGGSESSGSAATPGKSETPAQTDDGTHHDENGHGHTHTGGGHQHVEDHTHDSDHAGNDSETEAADEAELAAFESNLRKWFVDIDSLAVVDSRVRLTYVTQSTRSHELAAGIETVVVSFIQAYTDEWSVRGLDAEVVERSGDVIGYWRTESRWVEPVVEGHETRTALLERTLNTHHGRLTRDHDHGETGTDHSRTESGHEHRNGTEHPDH